MNTLKASLLLCNLIFPLGISAQTVSGKLIDENSQPLPYANVILLSLPDSAFVSGTISGEDGSFTLGTTSENQIVKISSIGYKTEETYVFSNVNIYASFCCSSVIL